MQTFLPYADFARSAAVLDDRRLGKQRVEGIQIVRALTVPAYAWKSHPAVLMWAGHEPALEAYLVAVCDEWAERGFDDTCRETIRADLAGAGVDGPVRQAELAAAGQLPPWLGDEAVHRSHRASLPRKDPDHYAAHFAGERLD
ncbi:MAG TPA: MSMEG_6728 family protein, partial [Acidimicrobiales bacterium]|nr:MSMEG_6728 family protein [Acidimicrobiales bacterium]